MSTPPRAATSEELDAIGDIIDGDRHNFEWQETRDQLDAARVAVFPDYISDSPGYCGRVAVVVWAGGPELFDVFTLDGETPACMLQGEGVKTYEMAQQLSEAEAALRGDATFLYAEARHGHLEMAMEHPIIVGIMADALAKMIGGNNYVEMRMKHKLTGEEFTVHLQRLSRPTPHELRRATEAALRELVALKAIKEECGNWRGAVPDSDREYWKKYHDYERRQPLAWKAARAVMADIEASTSPKELGL